jgi:hypothetical protein
MKGVITRFRNCRGAFIKHTEDPNEAMIITRVNYTEMSFTKASSSEGTNEKKHSFIGKIIYHTKLEHSFLTIMPVIMPTLPGFVSM